MLNKERECLETKFRNLAMIYLKMRAVFSETGDNNSPHGFFEKIGTAEQAIKEYVKTQLEISPSTQRNIEEFGEWVEKVTAANFNKQGLKRFLEKLDCLVDEFIGRAIDIRDGTYEHPPCSGCWHVNLSAAQK